MTSETSALEHGGVRMPQEIQALPHVLVAEETQLLLLLDQQLGVPGGVGLVTDDASTGGDRPVRELFAA